MCWSWPVSLCFSLFQWIIIAYIVYRNRFMDRWLAVMQIPIATQEFLQFLLWAFAIDDDTTASKCSTLNQYLSYNLLIIVMIVPVIWTFTYVYKSADFVSFRSVFSMNWANWRQKISFIMFIVQCPLYILHITVSIVHDIHYGDSHCSYKGENGHQEWALMGPNIEGVHWGYINLIQITYTAITIYPIFTYRPLWILLFTFIYGLVSAIVTILVTNPTGTLLTFSSKIPSNTGEWGSLWCWANFVQIIWFCLVSPIIPKVLEKYNDTELQGSCANILFGGTSQLFKNKQVSDKTVQYLETEMQQNVILNEEIQV
eukprot:278832_1